MKKNMLLTCLLMGTIGSVPAFSKLTVDKSSTELTITSDKSGIILAQIISSNDQIIVNEKYSGYSFSWIPADSDGTYRYNITIIPDIQCDNVDIQQNEDSLLGESTQCDIKNDYLGGSVEIVNGKILLNNTKDL